MKWYLLFWWNLRQARRWADKQHDAEVAVTVAKSHRFHYEDEWMAMKRSLTEFK